MKKKKKKDEVSFKTFSLNILKTCLKFFCCQAASHPHCNHFVNLTTLMNVPVNDFLHVLKIIPWRFKFCLHFS